jgi:hypothetical protein
MSGSSGVSGSSCGESAESGEFSFDEQEHLLRGSRRPPEISQSISTAGAENVLVGVIGHAKLNRSLDRLVEWNTGALLALLKRVAASRSASTNPGKEDVDVLKQRTGKARSFIAELNVSVPLPDYDADTVARAHNVDVKVPSEVKQELRLYVAAIASGYRKNAFHNFGEHILCRSFLLVVLVT